MRQINVDAREHPAPALSGDHRGKDTKCVAGQAIAQITTQTDLSTAEEHLTHSGGIKIARLFVASTIQYSFRFGSRRRRNVSRLVDGYDF